MPAVRTCKQCGREYSAKPSERLLFCVQECYWEWQKHNTSGESNNAYKGDNVSYAGIHKYVGRVFDKPSSCERCSDVGVKMEWSNNDNKYRRVRDDWEYLCVPCHRKKDAWRRTKDYLGSRWNKQLKKEHADGK